LRTDLHERDGEVKIDGQQIKPSAKLDIPQSAVEPNSGIPSVCLQGTIVFNVAI